MEMHPDRICRWCGWRSKWYGPGLGRDRDGYRCMKYVDLKMQRRCRDERQLPLPALDETEAVE